MVDIFVCDRDHSMCLGSKILSKFFSLERILLIFFQILCHGAGLTQLCGPAHGHPVRRLVTHVIKDSPVLQVYGVINLQNKQFILSCSFSGHPLIMIIVFKFTFQSLKSPRFQFLKAELLSTVPVWSSCAT